MTKITIQADCGNSPKNEFLKAFQMAFAEMDNPKILEMISDDVEWQIVGHNTIVGKEAFQKAIEGLPEGQVKEVILEKVLSHGKLGAASGKIIMMDGSVFAFGDMYEFNNTKGTHLRTIQSFNILVKE